MLSAAEKKSAQVYRWLLAYIDENKFSGNQRLPSENALCRKLGVSRETIRVAIDRLVNEGIVYKVKGSGTYFHREKVMTRDLNTEDALYKIGLVLQGQDTSANSGLIEGVRSVLTQEQVDLHVFLTDNKFCNERRCLETVVHQNFHGFIVDGVKSSILSPNLDCYKELYRRKIPVIFYNNFYRNLRCPRVTINDIECAHQLIERLMDAGHSHIAGIFVYDNYQSVEKFQGMAEAMRNRGLELNDDYIKWCISDEAHNESYVRSIERFLKSIPKCTAIVCCNYIIYRLVMKTLQKMGKTVPEDYSLVCFDYSEETYRQEDVTCSVEQGFEMGRQLALRLMEMISTGECDDRNYTYVMKPILSVISVFYNAFATNRYIALLLKGMQAGVAAVILDVVFDLGGKVLKTRSWVYIALMAGAFIANTVFDVNVVVVILAAAAFGVVRALAQRKKGGAE